MRTVLFPRTKLLCVILATLFFAVVTTRAAQGDLKLEAQLVLGSNDDKPAPGLKPVSKDIEKKLKHLPLKWQHYYVEADKKFNVGNAAKSISLSKSCQISVKNLGDARVELTLASEDKTVGRVTQSLRKGQTLVAGAGDESRIVVLMQQD
jgi:hypothetical protein